MDQKKCARHFLDPGAHLDCSPKAADSLNPAYDPKIDFFGSKIDFCKIESFWVLNLLLSFLMSHNEPKESMCIPKNRQN